LSSRRRKSAATFDLGLSKTFQEETVMVGGEKSNSAIIAALGNEDKQEL
jgi:hypothetical protein